MTISELPVVRIIDDNDVMRESLVFLLEEEDGWIVKAYRDAEEFLDNDDFEQAGCRHGHSCSEARGFRPVAKTC